MPVVYIVKLPLQLYSSMLYFVRHSRFPAFARYAPRNRQETSISNPMGKRSIDIIMILSMRREDDARVGAFRLHPPCSINLRCSAPAY
jgi:hypothetical protein